MAQLPHGQSWVGKSKLEAWHGLTHLLFTHSISIEHLVTEGNLQRSAFLLSSRQGALKQSETVCSEYID